MGRLRRSSGLLLALVAIPGLTGCAVVGLPELREVTAVTMGSAGSTPDPFATPAPEVTPGHVASRDGYSLRLPPGWGAADLSGVDGFGLLGSVSLADATLGGVAMLGLQSTGARLSLLGMDLAAAAGGGYAPAIVVATMRTRGMPRDAARTAVEALLAQAPLAGSVGHTVETHPAGDAHRYSAVLEGDSVALQVEVHVFRVGGDSFFVGALAPVESFAGAQPAFDIIVKSLRFGV